MNLRNLGYVVETVEVSTVEELVNAVRMAKRKPVELVIPRNLYIMVESQLKKSRYVYMITSASDERVTVSVAAPEALLALDSRLYSKSRILANPISVYSLLYASTVDSAGDVASQYDLLKLVLSKPHGVWFYVFVSDEYCGRAYLLTNGAKVHGAVYMDALTYYGELAIRLLFYRLPYRYTRYKVQI